MYIIASHHSNEENYVFDSVIIERTLIRDLNEAIEKAKQLFNENHDEDRDAGNLVPITTCDVYEFNGAPVVFGIGEYEDDDYESYHLVYAVIEVSEQS